MLLHVSARQVARGNVCWDKQGIKKHCIWESGIFSECVLYWWYTMKMIARDVQLQECMKIFLCWAVVAVIKSLMMSFFPYQKFFQASKYIPDICVIRAIQKIVWASGCGTVQLVFSSNEEISKIYEKVKISMWLFYFWSSFIKAMLCISILCFINQIQTWKDSEYI